MKSKTGPPTCARMWTDRFRSIFGCPVRYGCATARRRLAFREFLSRWGSPVPENTARPNDTDAIGCAKDWRCSADASLAGQSAALARAKPASDIITAVWTEAEALLRKTVIDRR